MHLSAQLAAKGKNTKSQETIKRNKSCKLNHKLKVNNRLKTKANANEEKNKKGSFYISTWLQMTNMKNCISNTYSY